MDLATVISTISPKPLSTSLAGWLLSYFSDEGDWDPQLGQRKDLETAVTAACDDYYKKQKIDIQQKQDINCGDGPIKSPQVRQDPRKDKINEIEIPETVRLYTDYEVLKSMPILTKRIVFVENKEDADYIFTTIQVKNFLSMPVNQRICQFPYESSLIRKDLLPLTVRQHCYKKDGSPPLWWLPCYDLSTEFHLFRSDQIHRSQMIANSDPNSKQLISNRWILKPAQGTRGLGHRIVDDISLNGAHLAALNSPLLPDSIMSKLCEKTTQDKNIEIAFDGEDRVAQLLVDFPLLLKNRKFDMRIFVFVRSFAPNFEAYVHQLFYARLANKEYNIQELQDHEVSISVSAYDEDQAIANKQERILCSEIALELQEQYGEDVIDYVGMMRRTNDMLSELFRGAARSIGEWPNSSAYYSVDVIYDVAGLYLPTSESLGKGFIPQPKLVEVNFMGDWHGVEAAVGLNKMELYPLWANDLLTVLILPTKVLDDVETAEAEDYLSSVKTRLVPL